MRMGGIPNVGTMNAAAKQVILAVADDAADSVLWWKFWRPKFPKPLEKREGRGQEVEVDQNILFYCSRNESKTFPHFLLATLCDYFTLNNSITIVLMVR